MRNWYKFIISDRIVTDIKDRFKFTNYQLIQNNKNLKIILILKILKKMNFSLNSIIF